MTGLPIFVTFVWLKRGWILGVFRRMLPSDKSEFGMCSKRSEKKIDHFVNLNFTYIRFVCNYRN